MSGVQFYRDIDLPFFELKTCSTADLSYKKHAHEEYSLGIVDTGESSFWYDGKIVVISPKTLILIPPEAVHSCNPHKQNQWKYKMLFINPHWVHRLMNYEGRILSEPVVKHASGVEAFRALKAMIDSLRGHGSSLEKESNVLTVFEHAIEGTKRTGDLSLIKERSKLKTIKEYLHSHYLEKITLDQLEKVSGLNKFTIIRSFKAEFKIPPHTYQTLLRVNYAKKELRNHRQITEVAVDAGFYDQSHFCKVFKSYTGATPDQYQKLI